MIVWRDDAVTTATCPVLAFTEEVERITKWFALCYELEFESMTGQGTWRRRHWPRDGGVGDQEARLVFGMEYLCEVQNELILEERRRRKVHDYKRKQAKERVRQSY